MQPIRQMFSASQAIRVPIAILFAFLCLFLNACSHSADPSADHKEDTTWQKLTIPGPNECSRGIGIDTCVDLFNGPNAYGSQVSLDGANGQYEYVPGLQLPFTSKSLRDTDGTINIVSKYGNTGYRVLLRNIPFRNGTSPKIGLFFDFDRYAETARIDQQDYGFWMDLQLGTKQALRGSYSTVTGSKWVNSSADLSRWAVYKYLHTSGSTYKADIEIDVTLPVAARAGFGLHVQTNDSARYSSSFPAELDQGSPPAWWNSTGVGSPRNPRNYQSIVTSNYAVGEKLKFLTWNAKRFNSFMQTVEDLTPLVGNFDTSDIPSAKIAALIAEYDVVSLQEIWSRAEADTILTAANRLRAELGLRPYNMVSPPDQPADIIAGFRATIGNDTDGGIYIFTHLPVIQSANVRYADCAGEDCLQAKGAIWARLALDYETAERNNCYANPVCDPRGNCFPQHCDALPSGRRFIDVYNTHIQNINPVICTAIGAGTALGWLSSPPWATLVGALIADDLHCGSDTKTLITANIAELATFVHATQAQDRDAIVMGDFNLDGRNLAAPEYAQLLAGFGMGWTPPSTKAHPWWNSLTFDIDFVDIALAPTSEFVPNVTNTNVTVVEADKKRLDYIFMIPPGPMVQGATPSQFMGIDPAAPIWRRIPWPNDGEQLSDHYPVAVNLQIYDNAWSDKVRPEWPHSIVWNVSSVNTAGIGDCFGCGRQDLYANLAPWKTFQSAPSSFQVVGAVYQTPRCDDTDSAFWTSSNCMSSWGRTVAYSPVTDAKFRFDFELWDHDDTSANDQFDLFPFLNSAGSTIVDLASLTLRQVPKGVPVWSSSVWTDIPIRDYYPLGGCNQASAPSLCWTVTLKPRALL